jgi:outer membrane protein OmpA-like peptidoglycan-associated protein
MKAKFLVLSLMGALGLMVTTAQAQESKTTSKIGRNTVFAQDGGRWFIDLQAGAALLPLGKANNAAKFMDRVSLMPVLAVGQWHNPYFGTRLRGRGLQLYGFEFKPGSNTEVDRYRHFFGTATLDFMFDLVNYFGRYNPKTVVHVIPYVGLGAGASFTSDKENFVDAVKKFENHSDFDPSPVLSGGLILKFRLGKRVDLNLEGETFLMKANLFGTNRTANHADLVAMASAGLTFRLGKTDFEEVVAMDFDEINNLQYRINQLREENMELSKRPAYCPECPELQPKTTVVTKNIVENVVYFRLNSSKVDQNQLVNIYNTAQYAKENNAKIILVGYADVQTGNADINLRLSEKRANAVAKILTEQYGIDANDIEIDYKGDTIQPFERNEWNRVVIMTIK